MRIVCLITVGAFLLSIAIAESDVPIGTTGQYHHQKLPRPIILEPVVKSTSERSPFDWFFKMVSKVVETPKKPPPAIIGPINLPGMAGQVYIRQLENHFPWESSHIVIKMMTRDPITGMNVPLDSGQSYNRFAEPSRKFQKPHGHGMNNPSGRINLNQQNFSPSTGTNQYTNWHNQYRPYSQSYPNQYSKTIRGSSPNDFHHDDYSKNYRENYDNRHFQANNYNYNGNNNNNNNYNGNNNNNNNNNYNNNNNEKFQPISNLNHDIMGTTISSQSSIYRSIPSRGSNEPIYTNDYNDQRYHEIPKKLQDDDFYSGKADSPRTTQIPYLDYTNHPDDNRNFKITNDTQNLENRSLNNHRNSVGYRQYVRNDRMVNQNNRNHHFGSIQQRGRMNFRGSFNSQDFRGFREPSVTKFDLNDVGGIEVITAPNLKQVRKIEITDKNKDSNEKSEDSDLNQGEDSISMGNGKNLARGESAEHDNDEDELVNQNSRILRSRLSSYKIIDRSHRSQGSQNLTFEDTNENFDNFDRKDDKKNGTIVENGKLINSGDSDRDKERLETKGRKGNEEVVQRVMNLTASNRWRFQEGRRPTRVVKSIYRRRPIGEIVKNRSDVTESTTDEKNSFDSSSEN